MIPVICSHGVPAILLMMRHNFVFDGQKWRYYIGQCPGCLSIYWARFAGAMVKQEEELCLPLS